MAKSHRAITAPPVGGGAPGVQILAGKGTYESPIPAAPKPGPSDANGLRARIVYAQAVVKVRNISPRFKCFVNNLKNDCNNLLHGKLEKAERDETLVRVKVNQDFLESRIEEVHGRQGLCESMEQCLEVITEIRLRTDYGDYLAVSLGDFTTNDYSDMLWKTPVRKDWQEVARLLEKEEKVLQKYKLKLVGSPLPIPRPRTRLLNDIETAAERRGVESKQLGYEITQYAERNSYCHSGVKRMIDECLWGELAERTCADKVTLNWVFRGRNREQKGMRKCISEIQNEWFEWCSKELSGRIDYFPSEKALQRSRRRRQNGGGGPCSDHCISFSFLVSRFAFCVLHFASCILLSRAVSRSLLTRVSVEITSTK